MPNDDGFDAMTTACIDAYEAVREHGSQDLGRVAELLLVALGREIAMRSTRGPSQDDARD